MSFRNFELDLLVYLVADTYLTTVHCQPHPAVILLETCLNGTSTILRNRLQ